MARGNLAEARRVFNAGQRQWREEFQQEQAFFSLTNVLQAEIDYELDDLNEARSKIDEAMYTVEHVEAWFEMLASLYETVALTTYTLNGAASIEPMLARLEEHSALEQAATQLPARPAHASRPAQRGRRARRGDLQPSRFRRSLARSDSLDEFAWREWDLIGISLAGLALNERRLTDASAILQRLESDAGRRGRKRIWVRALVLKSALAHADGQDEAAHAALDSRAGARFGQRISANVPRRAPLSPAVRWRLLLASRAVPARETYANASRRKLQTLLGRKVRRPAKARRRRCLSAREREVLIEISLGHSNKVIAASRLVRTHRQISRPEHFFASWTCVSALTVGRRSSASAGFSPRAPRHVHPTPRRVQPN